MRNPLAEVIDLLATPPAPSNTLRGQKQRFIVRHFFAALFAVIAAAALAVAAHGQEVLQFGARWCGPCLQEAPIVEALRQRGFKIRHVDIDDEAEFAASRGFRRGVDRIPLTVAYDASGNETKRVEGLLGEAEIVGMLSSSVANAQTRRSETGDVSIPATPDEPNCPIEPVRPWADARVVMIRNYVGRDPATGEAGFNFSSGGIVAINGEARYVISCAHGNAGKGDPVWVVFSDGKTSTMADTLAVDREGDCSIIKLRCEPRKEFFKIAESPAKQGDKVWLAGLAGATQYRAGYADCIETQAKPKDRFVLSCVVIDGQSGGPVVGPDGYLVGVIDAVTPERDEYGRPVNVRVSYCCNLQPIRHLLDDLFPNRPGAIIGRATPPPALIPVQPQPQPQQVLPSPQDGATCDPRKFEAIESRLKALEDGKQDKGDYATRGDIPTIPPPPTQPDLSGYATKGDIRETHDLIDKVVGAIGPAIESRLSKLPSTAIGAAATHVLGVPTWLAAPVALVGGPVGVGLSLAALVGYRRLKRRIGTSSVTVEHAAAGGRRGDGFHVYDDVPVAGRIVPRDANGNPLP